MLGAGCSCQRQHPNLAGESEDHLRWSYVGLCGEAGDQRVFEHIHIRGEQREALVENLVLAAEAAHLAIPTGDRKATVLHKGGQFSAGGDHVLQMLQRHVADSEEAGAAGITLPAHRLPHLGVGLGPAVAGSRPVQQVAVDVIRSQMFQRASHGLFDLHRQASRWIVGQAMVLAGPIGEFRLQKNLGAGDQAFAISSRQRFADSGFVVMPPLIRGVDGAKTGAQRQVSERCCAFFFPGGAVEKIGDGCEWFGHRDILSRSKRESSQPRPIGFATLRAQMSAATEVVPVKRPRIESVDVVRGVVMILMALDHVRDFFGIPGANPTDLATTTVPLFFTRWVTHICAPVFFLLTGTGAYLALRNKSKPELSRFLFTRGLWLIFLELVPLRILGFQFNFDYHVTLLFILWALGWAMIALAVLVYLPSWLVTAFGAVMISTHNLFDSIQSNNPVWIILHQPGIILSTPGHVVRVVYPLIPWIGVTAVGYGMGQIYGWPAERRQAFLIRLGIALTAAFLVLRGINLYGDPNRWEMQKSAALTVVSFLNTTKYPPSLLFLLMTLGPAMLMLRAVDSRTPRFLRRAGIIGKVPMFYFALHIPLIHLLALIVCYARYGHVYWMFQSPNLADFPFTPPPGWGFSLPEIYLVWVLVVVMLYPLCRWYAALKQRRRDWWLGYF